MRAKYFKCNSHKLDCDISVWIDGSAVIRTQDFVQWCLDQLGDGDIALIKHPDRDCIYDEANVNLCLSIRLVLSKWRSIEKGYPA